MGIVSVLTIYSTNINIGSIFATSNKKSKQQQQQQQQYTYNTILYLFVSCFQLFFSFFNVVLFSIVINILKYGCKTYIDKYKLEKKNNKTNVGDTEEREIDPRCRSQGDQTKYLSRSLLLDSPRNLSYAT